MSRTEPRGQAGSTGHRAGHRVNRAGRCLDSPLPQVPAFPNSETPPPPLLIIWSKRPGLQQLWALLEA